MSLTAFPETERQWRRRFGSVRLDAASLRTRLEPCRLSNCRGTCCHDGAVLEREEAEVLAALAQKEASFFQENTTVDCADFLQPTDWRETRTPPRTRTRHDPHSRLTADYPAHFPDTACVFLMEDARCALQVLAGERGKHPWYWKPFACWMHPLSFREGPEGRFLTLPQRDADPQAAPDYPGFASWTHCGTARVCGKPASAVLAGELEFLGKILARDLRAELETPP